MGKKKRMTKWLRRKVLGLNAEVFIRSRERTYNKDHLDQYSLIVIRAIRARYI